MEVGRETHYTDAVKRQYVPEDIERARNLRLRLSDAIPFRNIKDFNGRTEKDLKSGKYSAGQELEHAIKGCALLLEDVIVAGAAVVGIGYGAYKAVEAIF